jgi:hypothetical protein
MRPGIRDIRPDVSEIRVANCGARVYGDIAVHNAATCHKLPFEVGNKIYENT